MIVKKTNSTQKTKEIKFEANKISINYKERVIFSDLSFFLEDGDRLQIKGKNYDY